MDRSLSPDRRAELVVDRMSLAAKTNLVTGTSICAGGADGRALGDAALGIPDVAMVGAGQGVANVCSAARGNLTGNTLLPSPLAMTASWDQAVAREDGALIGRETRQAGMNTSIGGNVNLARDPRHGRTFEAEGEDPLLAGTMVGAQLRGTQSQKVIADIKHFAFNNIEANRGTQSSNVDERTMRELELRAFEVGIKTSDAGAVMCSYNKVNGVNACENEHLLTDVLKRGWRFKGWVMSDWWACSSAAAADPVEGFCSTEKAANAGLDQEQPQARFFGPALATAVTLGQVPARRLDDMVHRILRTMFARGVIDDPPRAEPIDVDAGAATSQSIAERSAVLLRNEGDLLPLEPRAEQRIAVIGAPANAAAPIGQGSPAVTPAKTDTALGAIREIAPRATVEFADGADLDGATELARRADVALVFAADQDSEGVDRRDLSLRSSGWRCYLPGCTETTMNRTDQDDLVAAVAAANPRTAVVLMTGGPVTMPWVRDVPAVLEAWYPGEFGGHAIARLLFGAANPSGRLPITFPASERDLPTAGSADLWPGDSANIRYGERLELGYRWYDARGIEPLFPFGHGLSYGASQRYSGLALAPRAVAAPAVVRDGHQLTTVSFQVTNAGSRAARETPQVYVGFPASVGEPPKRLVGWAKRQIGPDRTESFSIRLDDRALAHWDSAGDAWRVAPGRYPVCVGASSRDLRLAAVLQVGEGTGPTTDPCPGAAR